jgi:DnaJ-class molecular chaperone
MNEPEVNNESVKITCEECYGSGVSRTINGDMGVDNCWCCDGYGYYREYYTKE